jgi:hypothetical protein
MASNPDSFKEVERMFNMSTDDRNVLQSIQEGLTGQRPIDNDWIDNIVATLKAKPEVFKTLFKSGASRAGSDAPVSPDQIESFIDFASGLDTWLLKLIARTIWFLSTLVKPAQDLYQLLDSYTFGAAKYLFMMIFAMVSYYVMFGLVHLFRILFVQVYGLGTWAYATINGQALPAAASSAAGSAAATTAAKAAAAAAVVGKVVNDASATAQPAATTAAAAAAAAAAGGGAAAVADEFQF